MRINLIIAAVFFLWFGTAIADPVLSIVPAVDQLLPQLRGKSVQTIDVDSRYGFDLEPVWKSFFRALEHRDRTVVRTHESSAPVQLSASYFFDPIKRTVTLIFYLYENGTYRGCSSEINCSADAALLISDFRMRFDRSIEEQRLIFRGKLVDRFQLLARSGKIPSLLKSVRTFRIENPQAVTGDWRNQIFIEQLHSQFGIRISDQGSSSIYFDPSGTVLFSGNNEKQYITSILPAKSVTVKRNRSTYLAPIQNGSSYERTTVHLPLEQSIVNSIEQFFCVNYPQLFHPFQPEKIENLFPHLDQSVVLTGSLVGEEKVKYQWVTPRKWVRSLEAVSVQDRTFSLTCDLREIIQDPQNDHRFWAVADQVWKTFDSDGRERYRDSGFLIVNFDFSNEGDIETTQIFYRIWIYDYPYLWGAEVATRSARLRSDIEHIFCSVNGIDSSLKMRLKESILAAQKTF